MRADVRANARNARQCANGRQCAPMRAGSSANAHPWRRSGGRVGSAGGLVGRRGGLAGGWMGGPEGARVDGRVGREGAGRRGWWAGRVGYKWWEVWVPSGEAAQGAGLVRVGIGKGRGNDTRLVSPPPAERLIRHPPNPFRIRPLEPPHRVPLVPRGPWRRRPSRRRPFRAANPSARARARRDASGNNRSAPFSHALQAAL